MIAIRGAITCSNSEDDIKESVRLMTEEIIEKNNLSEDKIVSVVFSMTKDLTMFNAATAFRILGYSHTPLFSCQEPYTEGCLEKCIRVLIFAEGIDRKAVKHIYLRNARVLRSDLND